MRYLVIIFLLCVLVKPLVAQAILEGPVTKIRDGDTIEVGQIPIRIQGLTCDELNTPKGQEARIILHHLLSGKQAICRLNGQVSYDRLIGRCAIAELGDIGKYLIKDGYCGRCKRYDEDGFYAETQKKSGDYNGIMPSYCG